METYPSSITTIFSSALLLVGSALAYIFFIVSSLSIARSRTARLEELVEEGTFGAAGGQKILEKPDAYLLYTQVGRFLASTGAGFCLAFLLHDIVVLFAERGTDRAYGPLLAALVFGSFILLTLVGVQIAKSLSLQYPERCLTRVSSILRVTYPLFGPVVLFLHTAVSRVLSRFQVRLINERELAVSADDLSEIVKMSSEVGSLEQSEMELIEGVVELSDRVVREIMTPRTDVVWVRDTARLEEIVRTCTQEAVSRVLVCGADLDEVRGVFLSKDLLRFVGHQAPSDAWKPFIRPAHFVPNTKAVDELLVEMREKGIHLSIVLDEHGGVDGVVTLEDLVEEIVGEIFDEFDAPSKEQGDVLERDGELFVAGAVPIEVLKENYDIELPDGNYDTVAGFVLAQLGRVPNAGEAFGVDGIEFHILEVDKQRVARVSIHRVRSLAPSEGEAVSPLLAANGAEPAPVRGSGPRSLRISEAS
jgi:putative hemolysin